MIRLLKFDIIHPREYLDQKKKSWDDLNDLSLEAYRKRLISLRSNYSDYYTYYLGQEEGWETEEFFMLDPDYYEKTARKVLGYKRHFLRSAGWILKRFFKDPKFYRRKVIEAYIDHFKPDVIFVRSHPYPSTLWKKFDDRALLISRLSARLPYRWHPNDWDLIYTDLESFKQFFEVHGVPTLLNDQGFDQRINKELKDRDKEYNCTFVGGMGKKNFSRRTEFFQYIARHTDLEWWGYWYDEKSQSGPGEFPVLKKCFNGPISGLEMYQIFRDSRISLNDYVDTAGGVGFNQRMFEVMGVGGFLLTRYALNLKDTFPSGIFVTYENEEDCVDKIRYYLKHEKERDEIALAAKKYVAENYNYERIAREFGRDCERLLRKKRLLSE